MQANIRTQIRAFITENFIFDSDNSFRDTDSFMKNGILDSTGVLQLVSFVEETFALTVEDTELVPENLDSVDGVSRFVLRKCSSLRHLGDGNANLHSHT